MTILLLILAAIPILYASALVTAAIILEANDALPTQDELRYSLHCPRSFR